MPTDNPPSTGSGVTTETMRAIIQDRNGSSGTLTLSTVDTPSLVADEVLVGVAGAGLDRGVWRLMTGRPYLVRHAGYGITKPRPRA